MDNPRRAWKSPAVVTPVEDDDTAENAPESLEARDSSPARAQEQAPARLRPEHVRAVRLGRGANCSSIGSVVDTLFWSAAVSSAVLAAICAALQEDSDRKASAHRAVPTRDDDETERDSDAGAPSRARRP